MDVDAYIRDNDIPRVSSLAINMPSSSEFHTEGLFSEEIFGPVGDPQRLIQFGYIELNTTILAPIVYKNLIKISKLYQEIMGGKAYAVFDTATKDFVRVHDTNKNPNANTGYAFFMRYFPELDIPLSPSDTRKTRVEIIDKYRNVAQYKRILVMPAGLRDYSVDENGVPVQDDINKLYRTLMGYTFGMPPNTENPVYDTIRFNIQTKAFEIYEYIENINTGKKGFLQGTYGSRRVALGTRNVITAGTYDTLTPDDPQALQHNETKVGIFQTLKGLQPIIIHYFKQIFIDTILGDGSVTKIPLTDPKTYKLTMTDISQKELDRFTSTEAIENWIRKFKNKDIRETPIKIDGKYLVMVYDTGKEISLFRNIDDVENVLGFKPKMNNIRPITWAESFYLTATLASEDRHIFITRYPIIGDTSTYPSKIHLVSTEPGRTVMFHDLLSNTISRQFPNYPILGNPYIDSLIVHSGRLGGLDGDYDGDTVSANFVMSKEANDEVRNYLGRLSSYIDVTKSFVTGGKTDIIELMIANLTKDPT